jgi:hypothetical protein
VSHLKRTFMRDQKPEAAASSSALEGRYRCGREWGRRSSRWCLPDGCASLCEMGVSCAGGGGGVGGGGGGGGCVEGPVPAVADGCLVEECSGLELLLRRAPGAVRLSDRRDVVEALRANAAKTAAAMGWGAGRRSGTRACAGRASADHVSGRAAGCVAGQNEGSAAQRSGWWWC